MLLSACKVIGSTRKLSIEAWGWVGFYLLHPTMTLGAFLGAVLFLPLVWLLPEDWCAVRQRSEHWVPSGTKQQRRQEVLKRRSLDNKLNKAMKRWRQRPRINGLTMALLTTAQLFPLASTSLPCQLAVPFSLCLTLPRFMLQPMLRSMYILTSPRLRYLRLATRVSECITALQDTALVRSFPPLKHASVGCLVGSRYKMNRMISLAPLH